MGLLDAIPNGSDVAKRCSHAEAHVRSVRFVEELQTPDDVAHALNLLVRVYLRM